MHSPPLPHLHNSALTCIPPPSFHSWGSAVREGCPSPENVTRKTGISTQAWHPGSQGHGPGPRCSPETLLLARCPVHLTLCPTIACLSTVCLCFDIPGCPNDPSWKQPHRSSINPMQGSGKGWATPTAQGTSVLGSLARVAQQECPGACTPPAEGLSFSQQGSVYLCTSL